MKRHSVYGTAGTTLHQQHLIFVLNAYIYIHNLHTYIFIPLFTLLLFIWL